MLRRLLTYLYNCVQLPFRSFAARWAREPGCPRRRLEGGSALDTDWKNPYCGRCQRM